MKSDIGKRLLKLRQKKGISRLQLAKELIEQGYIDYESPESLNQYLYMIEKGKRNPKDETLKPIAEYFNVPIQWLKGEIAYIPIVGETQAGSFGGHIADAESYFPLPTFLIPLPEPEEHTFFMEVEGDSMYPQFEPGDLVHLADPSFIPPKNGDEVVVIKDGEATLKKYYTDGNKVKLIPLNEVYKPIELTQEDLRDVMIFKVIGVYKRNR